MGSTRHDEMVTPPNDVPTRRRDVGRETGELEADPEGKTHQAWSVHLSQKDLGVTLNPS
jgi:hypothetical protein